MVIKTKEEFDRIVDMIKTNVEYYEKHLVEVQYKLFLANSAILNITYDKNHIPHLLGINMDYLRGLQCYREKRAYELLKAFLNDSYAVYRKDNSGSIFSDYVIDKNMIFQSNLKIQLNDINCVIDYQKDRIYGHEVLECPCDYYIVKKAGSQMELLILGLSKMGNDYVPQTSQLFRLDVSKNSETFHDMLYHQHITFCNALYYTASYESETKKIYLPFPAKGEAMVELNNYATKYDSVIEVPGDYSYVLKKINEMNLAKMRLRLTFQTISKIMMSGELIDSELLDGDLDWDLKELIQAYNNSQCSSDGNSSIKYSELLEKYKNLKSLVETLQNEKQQAEQQLEQQRIELENLRAQNTSYAEKQSKILELLK